MISYQSCGWQAKTKHIDNEIVMQPWKFQKRIFREQKQPKKVKRTEQSQALVLARRTIKTSKEVMIEFKRESSILAQDERWRRA